MKLNILYNNMYSIFLICIKMLKFRIYSSVFKCGVHLNTLEYIHKGFHTLWNNTFTNFYIQNYDSYVFCAVWLNALFTPWLATQPCMSIWCLPSVDPQCQHRQRGQRGALSQRHHGLHAQCPAQQGQHVAQYRQCSENSWCANYPEYILAFVVRSKLVKEVV